MKNWIISIMFTLLVTSALSQSLGFASHATPGLSDTLLKSSSITYGVTVQSTGGVPVTGNFNVFIAVQDSALVITVFDSVTVSSNSLQPGDSTPVTITHLVDPIYFMDGGNTVVIWPAAPGVQTTDTIFKDVFVIDFQSVADYENDDLIIYPNPATEYLYLQSTENIEKVRIWSLSGQLIYTGSTHIISVPDWKNGYYFIEAETKSGKLIRRKILVEN